MALESVKGVSAPTYQAPQVSVSEVATVEAKDANVVEVRSAAVEVNISDNSQADSDRIAEKEPSDATIKQAIKDINRKMKSTIAEFGYHEGTGRVTIKIKDKETDKIVKEIPAEKTLDMIEKAWELAGILVDEKR